MQSTLGLLTGTIVFAVAVGGIFALVFAAVYGRIGHARPRVTAATLALVAFAVIVLVPFLKYPSNPPAVGADETIGYRTRIYFVMLLLSVVAAFAALRVGRDAVKRLGAWNGVLVAVGSYLVLVAIAQVLMPSLDEIPPRASARASSGTSASPRSAPTPCSTRRSASAFGALAERWITQATRGAADTYRTSSPSAGALHS